MLILLLFISIIGSTLVFFKNSNLSTPYTSFRLAFLYALLGHSGLVLAFTELVSPFSLINRTTVISFWFLIDLLIIYLLMVDRNKKKWMNHLISIGRLKKMSVKGKLTIYLGVLILILPLFLLAIYTPPNNYDSHWYHLNRVLFWMWNGNVDHFPTICLFQLYNNVFAEYILLHVFLISGTDQFVNLVQFAAMLGSVVSVSLLAKNFGSSYRGQLLAGLIVLSLPIGILESTTTQNDYVSCFYFLCFVLFGYRLLAEKTGRDVLFFIISLVLGCFTKYTIFFFALPFAFFFGIQFLGRYGFRPSLKLLGGSMTCFLVVFGPFLLRNYQAFGDLLSPSKDSTLFSHKIPVDKFGLAYTASNVVKNIGLQIGLPYAPYNSFMDSVVERIHNWLGVNTNDPALSLDAYRTRFSIQEDMAPNTIYMFMLVIAVLFIFSKSEHGNIKLFFGLALLGFILFCTIFKFQLWSTRTQMPFLALGSVLVAQAACIQIRSARLPLLILFLFAISLPIIFGNSAKMIIPVRYASKKLTAYIPSDICPVDTIQAALFKRTVSNYYDCAVGDICYPKRTQFAYTKRVQIFAKLDSIHYYDSEKENSIWTTSRTKAYFLNHLSDYENFRSVLNYPLPGMNHVGVFFRKVDGFYHYWCALNYQRRQPLDMAYIRYDKQLRKLANAQKPYYYDYILTDDIDLLRQAVPTANITSVYGTGSLKLIRLKSPSKTVYTF
jgi:Dolichyl-phosphate-mannose-protein mannosyltransferase